MNIEYEYSFKVTDLKPFIKFVKDKSFEQIEENYQIRTLYKRPDKTMARVTQKGKKHPKFILDFKDDEDSDKVLKERRETLPIEVPNVETAESIINFLGYKKNKVLERTRYVFVKDNEEFELDSYESPEKMFVVAVEGKKDEVDKLYNEMITTLKEYII